MGAPFALSLRDPDPVWRSEPLALRAGGALGAQPLPMNGRAGVRRDECRFRCLKTEFERVAEVRGHR